MSSENITYSDSGVDIDAGNEFVNRIKPHAKSTIRPGADSSLGGFGALFDLAKLDYKDPILVSSTDGVGTKLKVAIDANKHDTIGIDLVAMCVNDLIVQGAEPLFFLDYFATGKLSVDQGEKIVSGIAEGCRQAGAALIGGETAEMPGLYKEGDYDLAGFSVGIVERNAVLPKDVKAGDKLIAMSSSGIHSNGYSLVRHIMSNQNISFSDIFDKDTGETFADVLLTPTVIYVKACLELIKKGKIKAMAHITGGGITENLPRVLPESLAANIDLSVIKMHNIFKWLMEKGPVSSSEMLKTFNCGVGMILVVAEENISEVCDLLTKMGHNNYLVGALVDKGDDQHVKYSNIEKFGSI